VSTTRVVPVEAVVGYFKNGFEAIKPNLPVLAVATFVLLVINAVLMRGVPLVGSMVAPFILLPLMAGLFIMVRHSMQGGRVEFPALFSVFSNTAQLVNVLIISAPLCVLAIAQVVLIKAAAVSLLSLVSLIAIAYAIFTAFALQRVVFAGRDAVTAIKESVPAVAQNFVPVLVFALLAFVVVVCGVLALLVGVLVAIPVIYAAYVQLYSDIFGADTVSVLPPPPPPPPAAGW
jgi:uncharacterized membrane protein